MKKQISILVICLMSMFTSTAQIWSAVGSGLNGTVNSLCKDVASDRLYATGAFTGKVAYWNGTTWNVIPGFPGAFDGLTIVVNAGNVFVGSDSIYRWNGVVWSTIQGFGSLSVSLPVVAGFGIKTSERFPASPQNGFNEQVIFSGQTTTSGGGEDIISLDPANNYAATLIGRTGFNQRITDMEVYNGEMYFTGVFAGIVWPGALTSLRVIKYNTSFVSVVSTATASSIITRYSAKRFGPDIFFTGNFSVLNGITSPGFIKYSTSAFISTATISPNNGVMENYSGNLYASSGAINGMQFWNGSTWTNIANPIGQVIHCLAVYHGELFAGGNFTTPFANIAKYNANPALILSQTHTNVSCNGGNNGTATCSVSGGLPGYTYSWSPGSYTTSVVTGLNAGTYTCTVTDAATMVQTLTVTITQPSIISATQSQTNVSCNGGNNGSATLLVSGGTPGYTYSWSPSGGTLSTASGLNSGIYNCLITDANSCTSTKTFTITQPTALVATTSSTNESGTSMNDGSASVNPSGGTSPYTYSWTPSGQTTQTAIGLTGGVYNCTITDNNGCTTIKTVTVTTSITTGVNSYTLPIGVSIYPNPSNGQFNVDAGNAIIIVTNSIGQDILHLTIDSKVSIDLDKPGMYFVCIIKDGKTFNSRLINQ